jgi:F0F1-type ATP synthase gamma subunit
MSLKNDTHEELDLVNSFAQIIQTYQEISVMKMQRVRASVVQAREFIEELSKVFGDVRDSYQKQIVRLLQKNKGKGAASFVKKNGKVVSVMIMPNTKLYGDIPDKVFKTFKASLDTADEVVILGRLGKDLYDQLPDKKPYTYYDLPTEQTMKEVTAKLAQSLVNYQQVDVSFGKFTSVVTQESTTSTLSSTAAIRETDAKEKAENIFQFFETQVFNSMLKQTLKEAELAAHASRIKAMEESLANIEIRQKSLKQLERRAARSEANKKQLEMLAGVVSFFR